MSYTLRGRIETRLLAALPVLLLALAVHRWWAIELVGLMLAVGLVLDATIYHRGFPYQPGWYSVPFGLLELVITYATLQLWHVGAPVIPALLLYGLAWLSAVLLGQVVLPLLRLEYAEAGGEPGRVGGLAAFAAVLVAAGGLGADYSVRPPTVHLHGTVQGPLVIRHAETVVGGVVRGGIKIRANHVTLRHVTVVGGRDGIDIEHADDVLLDHVRVAGNTLTGIRAYDSHVMVSACLVDEPAGPLVSGILISYSIGRAMSMVVGCTISGTREGIATHSSEVDVTHNRVSDTSERGILLGEMSMDMASHNKVVGAKGIGIICMDHSMCEIKHNTVVGTKVDGNQDPTRQGVAIQAYYYAEAQVHHNKVVASPGGIRAFDNSTINAREYHN